MIISFDTFGAWATAVKEAKQEQEKNITITENGTGSVLPDSGKTLSKVDYTVDVHPKTRLNEEFTWNGEYILTGEWKDGVVYVDVPGKPEREKTYYIPENGVFEQTPDLGTTISKVTIKADVHPTEKLTTTITENGTTELTGEWKDAAITVAVPQKEEQAKSVTITENGTTTVSPDAGKVLSSVAVTVNVAGGATKVDVGALGIKFAFSTFTKVPDMYDFNNCTNMQYMFSGCSNLTSLPVMDTSKVTTMEGMFYDCSLLATVPELDTSKVTTMEGMFRTCSSIKTVPQMDTSKVVTMAEMFSHCYRLTEVPVMDTGICTNMQYMFNNCGFLVTITQLDMSKVTDAELMFSDCSSLTSLTLVGSLNTTLTISKSPLNEESIKSVLIAASKTTNTTAKTLYFKTGSTFTDDAEGTWAALVADCTTKGWTINNLTITPAA